jgi:hypothetical protein
VWPAVGAVAPPIWSKFLSSDAILSSLPQLPV